MFTEKRQRSVLGQTSRKNGIEKQKLCGKIKGKRSKGTKITMPLRVQFESTSS